MIIKIDNRETELIKSCQYILSIGSSYKDITIVIESLPIGDVILIKDGVEIIIIERKSIQDLSSSIKDGRYEEQSYRLNANDVHNHNIMYLIEGDMNKFNIFKGKYDKMMLYSAMVSLNFYKGFSVTRSLNIDETALIICNMAYKINKSIGDGRKLFYSSLGKLNDTKNGEIGGEIGENSGENSGENGEIEQPENYCNVVKKVKKENITPENIGEIMLSQIPGISSVTAIAIMQHFKTLPNLIIKISEEDKCLNNITYINSKGQSRKISKLAINNVIKFLKNKTNQEK